MLAPGAPSNDYSAVFPPPLQCCPQIILPLKGEAGNHEDYLMVLLRLAIKQRLANRSRAQGGGNYFPYN